MRTLTTVSAWPSQPRINCRALIFEVGDRATTQWLVQDQTADDVFALVEAHWQRLGMPNLVLNRLASTDPTQSPLDSAIVQALQMAARTVYGKDLAVKPRHESSGRQAIWLAQHLGVPGAISGIGPPNWRGHAPDEFIRISYFISGIKYVAATVLEFARRSGAQDAGDISRSLS